MKLNYLLKIKIEHLVIKGSDVEISNSEKKIKKYVPLSKRQDKPDSALWLLRQHNSSKRLSNCKIGWGNKKFCDLNKK